MHSLNVEIPSRTLQRRKAKQIVKKRWGNHNFPIFYRPKIPAVIKYQNHEIINITVPPVASL